jgi:hypothetical protein
MLFRNASLWISFLFDDVSTSILKQIELGKVGSQNHVLSLVSRDSRRMVETWKPLIKLDDVDTVLPQLALYNDLKKKKQSFVTCSHWRSLGLVDVLFVVLLIPGK